jgi:hypothetical protein
MFIHSQHLLQQIQLRNIALAQIEEVLQSPDHVIMEDGLTVFQKLLYENNKRYFLRIFVNEKKQPPVVVTAYKTSKINKYLLS